MSTSAITRLRVAVVGCRGMGVAHARAVEALPEYVLVAACDLDPSAVEEFAAAFPDVRTYTDYDRMLAQEHPDVVVVATTTASHAPLTMRAVDAGVRGVFCEKPMATNLADGRAMLEACRRRGTALVVNHQRRTWPDIRAMRRVIEQGQLGTVESIRAGCAGDVLSDGTHLIDTVRYLAGDAEARWVFAQIYREPPGDEQPGSRGTLAAGGMRYGHPVETGAFALIEFETGLRAELQTGAIQARGRRYQDYEILGTAGRLRRAGDGAKPPLLIETATSGGWQPLAVEEDVDDPFTFGTARNFALFAQTIRHGAEHPLAGESGLKDLELVMAIYESARLRDRIALPLDQPRFPLELLIEDGEL